MVGQKLKGRYLITDHLGGGGFGQTYLAQDEDCHNNPCVIKKLQPSSNDPFVLQTARRLFAEEAKVLNKLGSHDQIPRLFAYFEDNQEFYLVQEYIEGKELTKLINPGQTWSENQVISLVRDILEILVFVQENNVIHRDINPRNLIRRDADQKIVLIDFGAVKEITTQMANMNGQPPQTVMVGTPNYMPDEQKLGRPNFSSDIYAVGIIAIQSLTGKIPIPQNWSNQVQISNNFVNVLKQMVCVDYQHRYQSANQALEAINHLSASSTVPNHSHSSPIKTMFNWPRDHKLEFAGVCVTFAGVCVAVIFGILNLPKPPEKIKTYEDTQNGIKVEYPESWQVEEQKNAPEGDLVDFIASEDQGEPEKVSVNKQKKVKEKVSVNKQENVNENLSEYKDFLIKEVKNTEKNVKIVEENNATFDQKNGLYFVYTTQNKGLKMKKKVVLTVKEFKGYTATYEAEEGKYDKYLPVADKIIKSVDIKSFNK